jgi:hypothetical protein
MTLQNKLRDSKAVQPVLNLPFHLYHPHRPTWICESRRQDTRATISLNSPSRSYRDSSNRFRQTGGGYGEDYGGQDGAFHHPTRPVDKDKAESELSIHIKKATSPEETAPKQKHVRSQSSLGVGFLALTRFVQNASSTRGIITVLYLFGVACVFSLF